MPAISQIGFGTDDYSSLSAWWTAEQNNDYSGAGPIAEISSSVDQTLTANLQIRFGSSTKSTIRAVSGSEFDGDLGGTHAKILGGYDLDIRKSNFNLENIDFTGGVASTGDAYDNMTFSGCCIRGQVFLDKTVSTPVSLDNTIVYSTSITNNRVIYVNGSDTDLTNVTVVATNASSPLGAIYVRNSGSDVTINDVAVYSGSGDTYEIHGGDSPTVTGDYNAGSDALLPGGNSISTMGTDDFEDYGSLDFRIVGTSELIGAGTGGGDIGAFTSAPSGRAITNIDGDNDVLAGQTSVIITCTNLDASPSTQIATLGGETLTINSWSATSVDVDIPLHIDLEWDATDHQLSLTDDTGTVIKSNITLTTPTGWESVTFNGSIPNPSTTESLYEESIADLSFTGVVNDVYAWETQTGLSHDAQTLPTVAPPSTVSFDYKVYDDSLATWTSVSQGTWTDGGAGVGVPVLSAPTGVDTSSTTATGTVSTTEGNGTLYYYTTTNSSETAATIKASGSSQAVSTAGTQNVSVSGLTASTAYYLHYVADNGTESNVVSSSQFTTPNSTPVLSLPTVLVSSTTTITGTVSTTEGDGTLYYYTTINSSESAATIKASGSSQAVSASGVQPVSDSGLTASTAYYLHYVQNNGTDSNVVSTAQFTTFSIPVLSSPTGVATSSSAATGTVSTTEGNGTLFYSVTVNSSETAAAIKAGGSFQVSSSGTQNVSASGLAADTAYYLHYVQNNGTDSNVVSSSQFTTTAISAVGSFGNESAIAFFREATGLDIYQFNDLALAYYKSVGSTASSFNDALRAAQISEGFIGLSPVDWRNF